MRRRLAAFAALLVTLVCAGFALADVTGSNEKTACASATASTPDHVVGIDGGPVYTIPGDFATDTQCVTVTADTVTQVITTTVATDTTGPSVPANFRLDSSTNTSLSLAWDASTDDTGVAGYELKFHNDPDYIDAGNSLSRTFDGLNCDGQYNLDLRAYDAAGNRSGVATVGPISPGCATPTDPPGRLVLFGASTPPSSRHGTTTREGEARWIEGKIGRKLGITRHYVKATNGWLTGGVQESLDSGRSAMVTFTSGGDTWPQVAGGSLDGYVKNQCAATKQYGKRLWTAFENEPEADPGKGSAADYVRAYEHIIGVEKANGCLAHITTALMEFSWQSGSGRNPEAWIPNGIDTLGVHGYSTRVGSCGGGIRSFVQTFDAPEATAAKFGLRMGIWEAGYSTAPGADPQAKGDFFRSMAGALDSLPLVDAFTYWNSSGGGCAYANSYFIDSSPESLQGFADAGHAAVFGG